LSGVTPPDPRIFWGKGGERERQGIKGKGKGGMEGEGRGGEGRGKGRGREIPPGRSAPHSKTLNSPLVMFETGTKIHVTPVV